MKDVVLDPKSVMDVSLLVSKQLKWAHALAVTRATWKAKEEVEKEMARVFDRPTPWVMGGLRLTQATRNNPVASLYFDFWGNKQGVSVEMVLKAEVDGGARHAKRFEVALRRVGVLPPGMFVIPGAGADMDAYGNISPGQIVQIISWFQAFGEQGYRANMKDSTKKRAWAGRLGKTRGYEYVAMEAGNQGNHAPGIYKRLRFVWGSSLVPVMLFVRTPMYRQRLDFFGIAQRVALESYTQEFPRAVADAERTAL